MGNTASPRARSAEMTSPGGDADHRKKDVVVCGLVHNVPIAMANITSSQSKEMVEYKPPMAFISHTLVAAMRPFTPTMRTSLLLHSIMKLQIQSTNNTGKVVSL